MAFREIERLKEVLELERSKQEALVSKLQQQNHEVTAEVSHILNMTDCCKRNLFRGSWAISLILCQGKVLLKHKVDL